MAERGAIVKRAGAARKRVRFRPSAAKCKEKGHCPQNRETERKMQVKCESCGAMFFVPNVKKGKEVACRKCGAKTVAEPSKEAGARLATTIRETSVNDMAAETYSKMAADSVRAEKSAPEPGDKIVAWGLRIFGPLFVLGVVFGIVAIDGHGMDDWQGPAAVSLLVGALAALIPICSFAALFNSQYRTKRLVHWLALSDKAPPTDLGNPAGSTDGWSAYYVLTGGLFVFVSLCGLLDVIGVAAEANDSFYRSKLAGELLGWHISLCAGGLLLGFKNFLLCALFQHQSRFADEVMKLVRKRTGEEETPDADAGDAEDPDPNADKE